MNFLLEIIKTAIIGIIAVRIIFYLSFVVYNSILRKEKINLFKVLLLIFNCKRLGRGVTGTL
jgi:hypothetical protein